MIPNQMPNEWMCACIVLVMISTWNIYFAYCHCNFTMVSVNMYFVLFMNRVKAICKLVYKWLDSYSMIV